MKVSGSIVFHIDRCIITSAEVLKKEEKVYCKTWDHMLKNHLILLNRISGQHLERLVRHQIESYNDQEYANAAHYQNVQSSNDSFRKRLCNRKRQIFIGSFD